MPIKSPLKKAVQARDCHACKKCGKKGKTQLHHIVPQRLDGPDDLHNLICLCHECHKTWHQIEAMLGIGLMAVRVKDTFFKWLKEATNDTALLGHRQQWEKFKSNQLLSEREKEKPKKRKSGKAKTRH